MKENNKEGNSYVEYCSDGVVQVWAVIEQEETLIYEGSDRRKAARLCEQFKVEYSPKVKND